MTQKVKKVKDTYLPGMRVRLVRMEGIHGGKI